MKQIPNFVTLLNLFAGCLAIVFALQTEAVTIYVNDNFESSFNVPERLTWAAICIFAAAIIDFFDGFVARMFNATSEMGKQLDSLSDVVSFGVAPGVILYQLLRFSYAREEDGLNTSLLLLLPAFLVSCAAAWRLAKFNIDTQQTYHFRGVPTPAIGLLIASFPLILHYPSFPAVSDFLVNKWVLYGIIIMVSYLMVCNIPMIALKFRDKTLRSNLPKLVLAGIVLLSAIFLQWLAVPIAFIVYIILSLAYKKQF